MNLSSQLSLYGYHQDHSTCFPNLTNVSVHVVKNQFTNLYQLYEASLKLETRCFKYFCDFNISRHNEGDKRGNWYYIVLTRY